MMQKVAPNNTTIKTSYSLAGILIKFFLNKL